MTTAGVDFKEDIGSFSIHVLFSKSWRNRRPTLKCGIASSKSYATRGDVGEASYAAVPHLLRIGLIAKEIPWQLFALVLNIDLARLDAKNPLPACLA